MIPELHKILYGEVDHTPITRGRVLPPMTGREIAVQSGSFADQIMGYLSSEGSAKVSEIATVIGSTPQKTTKCLRQMVGEGILEEIRIDGCPIKYALSRG
jgi:hypothetical protein